MSAQERDALAGVLTVRTDAGWHTRFRATNGRIVWTTETYGWVEDDAVALSAHRWCGP